MGVVEAFFKVSVGIGSISTTMEVVEAGTAPASTVVETRAKRSFLRMDFIQVLGNHAHISKASLVTMALREKMNVFCKSRNLKIFYKHTVYTIHYYILQYINMAYSIFY